MKNRFDRSMGICFALLLWAPFCLASGEVAVEAVDYLSEPGFVGLLD